MVDGFMLKFLGELFYLIVGLSALYGLWNLFREYRTINKTVIKTHITAYELQKMVESRPRM
ncbi:MAG: hypothetical protein M0024_06540 [Nitrospiraceae bacterium]|nr:hypothetical protein [Nitrospiraceae bacterium]